MHLFLLLCLFLLSSHQCYASNLNTYLEIGVHNESFKLKLEDQNRNVENSFEKLEWNNWITSEIRIGAIYQFLSCFSIEAEGAVLLKTDSVNLSSTYRQETSSRSLKIGRCNKNISGNQFSVAIGYFGEVTPNVTLTTLVGYSEQRSNLHGHSGKIPLQTDSAREQHKIDLSNLKCFNIWKGPWIGCRLNYLPCSDLSLFLEGEYHYVNFNSHIHWKAQEHLSDNFHFDTNGSISHKGTAPEIKVKAGVVKDLTSHWKISLRGYYEQFFKQTENASIKYQELAYTPDERLFSQGSNRIKAKSSVQVSSWAILGGIDYDF